jgi:hypothetical protein
MKMKNSNLLAKVKSAYDNQDILVTITESSQNRKTGDIPQINMLVEKEKPTTALQTGADYSVCGDCILRPFLHKNTPLEKEPCYVNCGFAQNSVFSTYSKGALESNNNDKYYDLIRHGAYGDPAACGKKLNKNILKRAKKVLAYTHAWSKDKMNYLNSFCMASVHNLKEKSKAQKLGFRTFRTVKYACLKLDKDEIVCPNFTKNELQCKQCKLCDGNQSKAKNIVIPIH